MTKDEQERNERLEKIVSGALDRNEAERDSYLIEQCGEDAALLGEARSWLASTLGAETGFLQPPDSIVRAKPQSAVAADQGLVLGDYEVGEQIGEGGMARVYRARSRSTGQEVAIKLLSTQVGLQKRHLERFHRESLNQARLKHPGIVPVFADGTHEQWHWIAQELIEGHDLGREIELQRKQPLPNDPPNLLPREGHGERTQRIVEVVAQAAEALQYAHSQGVVHRDIKPSNLLLRPQGRVLIADFGLSRDEAMGDLTRTGEIAGSLYYMSPEQARSLRDVIDHRTDIYSLGVVLYELLALKRPFEAGTSVELIKRISESAYRPLRSRVADVPEPLEIIVDRALSRSPEQRFASMADFAEDLRRFQRGQPIRSRRPSPIQRAQEWIYRQRRWASAALLLAVLSPLGAVGLRRIDHWQTLASVTVQAAEAPDSSVDAEAQPWTIQVQQLDLRTDEVLEERELRFKERRNLRLEPGDYRFRILRGELLIHDLRVDFEASSETSLVLPSRSAPVEPTGMAYFSGGTLHLQDEGDEYRYLTLQGTPVEVAPFWLDQREVSNAEYRRFLEATGTTPPPHWDRILTPDHDDLPVVEVAWHQAKAFAEWSGKRLPTLAEWNWAARGPSLRLVPWSEQEDFEIRGNTTVSFAETFAAMQPGAPDSMQMDQYFEHVSSVDSYPEAASPEGVLNLLGNVCEWTETRVFVPQSGGASGWVPWKQGRYALGGHWSCMGPDHPEKDLRNMLLPQDLGPMDVGSSVIGFRCARAAR